MPEKDSERRAKVVDAILADPTVSNSTLARQSGYSKTQILRIRREPGIIAEIKDRLAQGGAGEAARGSVANLIGALSVVTDRMLASEDWTDESTAKALQLLAGLTGTLERMQRAGIDLTALASPDDARALQAELAHAWTRGVRAALRHGPRARVWADRLAARHAKAGPMVGEGEGKLDEPG